MGEEAEQESSYQLFRVHMPLTSRGTLGFKTSKHLHTKFKT